MRETASRFVLPGGERFEAVVAAAAPFPERAAGELFEPLETDEEELRARTRRWLDAAAADPSAADRLLRRRAAAGFGLAAGLRDVRLRDPRRLPDWAEALAAFLAAHPASADEDALSRAPGSVLASIPRAAEALLPWRDGTLGGIPVLETARDGIARALAARLWFVLERSVEFELKLRARDASVPASAELDVSLEGWLARFELLPGLAYAVGVTCRQFRSSVVELFVRLAADLPLLRRELWAGAEPGAVATFAGDAGDRHDDGRSVVLLGFESGHGVVYKPKDLRPAVAFMEICTFLNDRGLPLDLPTRTILPRRGYGWEERAVPGPCASRDAFSRFYRRLGMLLRLAQLLEGRDLWADNLLACGERPTFVDLECLLYPRVLPPPTLSRARAELLTEFERTTARTGILHQPLVPRPDLPFTDVGCLSRAGDAALPLPPYRPIHDGEVADGRDYGDEIAAGYEEMQAALAANRDALLAEDGPLSAFRGVEVRYIWRHTWDCLRILRASLTPRALRSGVEREIVLARVLRDPYGMLDAHADRGDLPEIAEAELDAFRQLDVPLFVARTDSCAPRSSDGRAIGDHFDGTAWDRLQQRLEELDTFPLAEHLSVVAACVDAARGGAETRAVRATHATPLSADELVAVAAEIAESIVDARLAVDGAAGWLALSWYPVPDIRQVEVASRDLLTGTGAVAVLLAEVAARTGSRRCRAASLDAAADLVELVGGSFAFTTEVRLAGGAPVPGGYAGPGGALHALVRVAAAVGDATLLDAARALVAPALEDVGSGRACADVPFGVAGLLLNVLRLRSAAGGLDDVVRALAASTLAALHDPEARLAPYAPTSRLADLVPVGRDSIALALARALAAAPELVDADAARAALRGHVCDLGTRGGRIAARELGLDAPLPADTTCRGLVAGASEALAAGARDAAAARFAELVARRRSSGRWFADRAVDDRLNLSAVDGVVAVGDVALALADPDLTPLPLLR